MIISANMGRSGNVEFVKSYSLAEIVWVHLR